MSQVVAYHVSFSTHGFWLPNDPRGSQSTVVRADHLKPFGPATGTGERQSVARVLHDVRRRRAAKESLVVPEVTLTGPQALSIANGFAKQIAKSGYVVWACSILPQHTHMVIRRHHYPIEQVVRLLRQAGTLQLLDHGLHPFAALRGEKGRLPSIWTQDFWKVFLFTEAQILDEIGYVEANPIKEGKRRQHWPFVTPYQPEPSV